MLPVGLIGFMLVMELQDGIYADQAKKQIRCA
jgi:hypothetical protein